MICPMAYDLLSSFKKMSLWTAPPDGFAFIVNVTRAEAIGRILHAHMLLLEWYLRLHLKDVSIFIIITLLQSY